MTESFAQLFEEFLNETEFQQGTIVKGTVVAIENGFVLVDAGLKSESAIPAEQFKNAAGELEVEVGSEVDVALDAVEDGFGETQLLVRKLSVTKLGSFLRKLTKKLKLLLVSSTVKLKAVSLLN
ncbi:SSU ribosomal protein S1p [Vibrio astriarenae]|nr:SSU ribosomal protein S1p [Vibrio sp. C7]